MTVASTHGLTKFSQIPAYLPENLEADKEVMLYAVHHSTGEFDYKCLRRRYQISIEADRVTLDIVGNYCMYFPIEYYTQSQAEGMSRNGSRDYSQETKPSTIFINELEALKFSRGIKEKLLESMASEIASLELRISEMELAA